MFVTSIEITTAYPSLSLQDVYTLQYLLKGDKRPEVAEYVEDSSYVDAEVLREDPDTFGTRIFANKEEFKAALNSLVEKLPENAEYIYLDHSGDFSYVAKRPLTNTEKRVQQERQDSWDRMEKVLPEAKEKFADTALEEKQRHNKEILEQIEQLKAQLK